MLESLGLFGLFLGCALSATIIPFSSEALLAAALLINDNVWAVVIIASLGNTLGGMVSFLLGWLCKWEWLEKYLKVDRRKLEMIRVKVSRYGYFAAFFAWLPFVGDLIAIAMGLMRMNPWISALLMFIGKLVRYLVIAGVLNLF
ncbi:MAG: DedA family protein [Bacteroidales bacterium]|jgi:membrane protein YqaA with SNARE-associated domain|nr:DedA family protein [Bacteroidales bacterium]